MSKYIRGLGSTAIAVTLIGCMGSGESAARIDEKSSAQQDGLQGAWRVASYRPAGGTPIANPAAVFLFTDRHYSIMYANTPDARAAFANPDNPTDNEKLRAYNSLIANAGAYIVTGDTIVTRPDISKHPGFMTGGEDRFLMRRAADTLWFTNVPGAFRWAGGRPSTAAGAPDSFVLVRAQ